MLIKGNLKDFVDVVKEYKKFFVPKYCSTPVFYLGLIFMLILPRRLFKLPNEKRDAKAADFDKYLVDSLSDKDKALLKETFSEYYGRDKLANQK